MPEETEEWTPGMRKLWRETWEMPHMKLGLREMQRRIKPKPLPIAPGYDALVLAAGAFNASVGKHETLDLIEAMGREEKDKPKSLPEPWSKKALSGEEEKPTPQ